MTDFNTTINNLKEVSTSEEMKYYIDCIIKMLEIANQKISTQTSILFSNSSQINECFNTINTLLGSNNSISFEELRKAVIQVNTMLENIFKSSSEKGIKSIICILMLTMLDFTNLLHNYKEQIEKIRSDIDKVKNMKESLQVDDSIQHLEDMINKHTSTIESYSDKINSIEFAISFLRDVISIFFNENTIFIKSNPDIEKRLVSIKKSFIIKEYQNENKYSTTQTSHGFRRSLQNREPANVEILCIALLRVLDSNSDIEILALYNKKTIAKTFGLIYTQLNNTVLEVTRFFENHPPIVPLNDNSVDYEEIRKNIPQIDENNPSLYFYQASQPTPISELFDKGSDYQICTYKSNINALLSRVTFLYNYFTNISNSKSGKTFDSTDSNLFISNYNNLAQTIGDYLKFTNPDHPNYIQLSAYK